MTEMKEYFYFLLFFFLFALRKYLTHLVDRILEGLYELVLAKHLIHWFIGNTNDYFYIPPFYPINMLAVSPSITEKKIIPPNQWSACVSLISA